MRQIPHEDIVYFGDTARVPYGSKSKDTIIRFSRQIIRFLKTKDVKAIVVACNTASAQALEDIRPELDIPILGVVKPGARVAAQVTENGKIGVIATSSTIESQLYNRVIHMHNPKAQVFGKACPLFVPLVEEGWLKDPVTKEVACRYLEPLMASGIDTLIMGCTHFPLLRSLLREILGEGVTLVNPAYETTKDLERVLKENGIANDGAGRADGQRHEFYVSDAANKFRAFADSILPYGVDRTQLIDIESY
jgi:glutamate racemase